MFQFNNMRGQSIIEVLVAIAVGVVVMGAITVAVTTSLIGAEFGRNQSEATNISQEGIDTMRNIRDSDYTKFSSYSDGDYCLAKNATSLTNESTCTSPNVDIFVRKVNIKTNVAGSCTASKEITVTTSWNDSRCSGPSDYCHDVSLVTCLSDSLVPTPR